MKKQLYQKDALLYSLIYLELEYVYIACLPEAMGTVKGLILSQTAQSNYSISEIAKPAHLKRGVPPKVDENDIVTCSQIETFSYESKKRFSAKTPAYQCFRT